MPSGKYKKTEEHKRKISIANTGKKHTVEAKKKISLAKKGKNNPMFGKISPNRGKKISKEIMEKRLKNRKYGIGKNSTHWKGGVTKIDVKCRKMKEYINWRNKVFQRDNYTCQFCNRSKCYVTAHHIISFSKLIKKYKIKNIIDARNCKELWNVKNGVTLCEKCHSLTDNYKGRARNK